MHISSKDIPSQNQLAIGAAHKLYIYTQSLKFYQCGINFTFIFQQEPVYVQAKNKKKKLFIVRLFQLVFSNYEFVMLF